MLDHLDQRFGVGFGKLDVQCTDHQVEEVVDVVVRQYAGHGVGAVGGHRRFKARAKRLQQRHQPRFHLHELQKGLVPQLSAVILGSLAGGFVADQVCQGFTYGVHVDVGQLLRDHGRQVAIVQHVVVVSPVGLPGIEHDAVTVEGNDLCSLSAIIRHWHFFSVGWARVEAPPKVSGRKPER